MMYPLLLFFFLIFGPYKSLGSSDDHDFIFDIYIAVNLTVDNKNIKYQKKYRDWLAYSLLSTSYPPLFLPLPSFSLATPPSAFSLQRSHCLPTLSLPPTQPLFFLSLSVFPLSPTHSFLLSLHPLFYSPSLPSHSHSHSLLSLPHPFRVR